MELEIQRKLSFQEKLFLVGELENQIIATAMFGYYKDDAVVSLGKRLIED